MASLHSNDNSMWAGLLFACLWVQSIRGGGAVGLREDDLRKIDEIVTTVMKCRDTPGLGLALNVGGKTVLQKGYGMADMETSEPVTENTLFDIASVTKSLSSALLAILLNEKGIPWNTPVKHILEDFEMHSDLLTNITTLNDLAGHRTGIISNDFPWRLGALNWRDTYERIRFTSKESDAGFRDKLHYNNIMFSVIGEVIQHLGGKPWRTVMREKLFTPLGMTATTFFDEEGPDWRNFAKAYVKYTKHSSWKLRRNEAISVSGIVGPAGTVSTNMIDMAKYLHFIVSGGKDAAHRQLLPTKKLKELLDPTIVLPETYLNGWVSLNHAPVYQSLDDYARGWSKGWYRGLKVHKHWGNMFGHDGMITYIPSVNSAIYSVGNGPSLVPAIKFHLLLHSYIQDRILGKDPWLNTSTICSYPRPWGKANDYFNTPPNFPFPENLPYSRPVHEYLGNFGNFLLGNITFVRNWDGRLEMHYGKLGRFALYPQKETDKFYLKAHEPLLYIPAFNSRFNPLNYVQFLSSTTARPDRVKVSFLNLENPPEFVKNLKLCQAPGRK